MNIYCRKTLQEYIIPAALDVFTYTAYALLYYRENFGIPYMFSKLDSVIDPEFRGAMEYPGAIIYTERLFPRRANTEADTGFRGLYVTHEVAHMWFGDAVSVKWWNDLWLKEAFADYIAFTALKDARDGAPDGSYKGILGFNIPDSMIDMFNEQLRGYKEDKESTSHPIAGKVVSTQEAETVFDAISYSKGAGVLKQLVFLIGRENFTKAMKTYFDRNMWNNTELRHLMEVYNEQLGSLGLDNPALDIHKWCQDWLETPGTNALELRWEKGSSFAVIVQTPVKKEFPTLRYHKIRVGFYSESAALLRTSDHFVNNVNLTEIDLGDVSEVAAILLNYDDYDFCNVTLDPTSKAFFTQNLAKLNDPLNQSVIIKSFYDMVKDATPKLHPTEFLDMIVELITPELTSTGIEGLDAFLADILEYYTTDYERRVYHHKIFRKYLAIAQSEKDKSTDKFKVRGKELFNPSGCDGTDPQLLLGVGRCLGD